VRCSVMPSRLTAASRAAHTGNAPNRFCEKPPAGKSLRSAVFDFVEIEEGGNVYRGRYWALGATVEVTFGACTKRGRQVIGTSVLAVAKRLLRELVSAEHRTSAPKRHRTILRGRLFAREWVVKGSQRGSAHLTENDSDRVRAASRAADKLLFLVYRKVRRREAIRQVLRRRLLFWSQVSDRSADT
jgi:hypothetical protein